MRTLAGVLVLLLLAGLAEAHGSSYRGPAGAVPPSMRRPEDPPPPWCYTWSAWWSFNKEEFLYPGSVRRVAAGEDVAPDPLFPGARLMYPDAGRALLDLTRARLTCPQKARVIIALASIVAGSGDAASTTDVSARLRELLSDPKQQDIVRIACAIGLGHVRDGSFDSRELLRSILGNPAQRELVRSASALGLGLLRTAPGDPGSGAIRESLAIAAWGEGEPSSCAFLALGFSGDPSDVRTLLDRLESEERGMGAACAAIGIGKLAETFPGIVDSRLTEALITASWALDGASRRGAVSALGQIGRMADLDTSSRLRILRTLQDHATSKDEATVALALVSLGRAAGMTPLAARRSLIRKYLGGLLGQDPRTRRPFAALALGLMSRGPELLPSERSRIRETLQTRFATIRRDAATGVAIGLVGLGRATPQLIALVRAGEEGTRVRGASAIGLALIGDPRGCEPVREALGQTKLPDLRVQAAIAAGVLGDRAAVRILLAAPRNESEGDRIVRLRALGKLGDGRALEPLLAVVEDGKATGSLRALAAIAIADLFDRSGRLPMTDLTRDLAYGLRLTTLDRLFSVF